MAAAALWLGATLGCGASAPARPPSLLIGVTQEGGLATTRVDGQPLLSEAYLVDREGKVVIRENYADMPSERRARTNAATARKLIDLLSSPAWNELSEQPKHPPRPDDVKVTIETEGKSVTRWWSRQEPIFREVLGTLVEIRSGGS